MTSLLGSNDEHKADFKEWSVLPRETKSLHALKPSHANHCAS